MFTNTVFQGLDPRLAEVLLEFATSYSKYYNPFYAHLLFNINIVETDEIPTFAVTFRNMQFYMLYNKEFLNSLKTKDELRFVIIHELLHIISNHLSRALKNNHNIRISNVVQDWIINEAIIEEYVKKGLAAIPKDNEGRNLGLFMPKEYTEEHIYEMAYLWAIQQQNMQNDTDDNSNGGNYGDYGRSCQTWDLKTQLQSAKVFDEHIESDDVTAELAKTYIEKLLQAAKSRGLMPAEFDKFIEKFKPLKNRDFEQALKQIARQVKMSVKTEKYKTIVKPPRREAAIKGKQKNSKFINVILDTSGSMWGSEEIEKLLGMVISANIAINLVQCDTEVKDIKTYSSTKKLKSGLEVKGGGGTVIQPAIDFIKKSKYKSFPILILTDGYTDTLDFGTTPGIVVTTDAEPTVIGKCKIIKLNKE